MLISKDLEKELRESEAVVLLQDGKDTDGKPRLVLRKIQGTWGECDPFKGGVCFPPLSDGNDHIRYESVLGYNTGRRASVQALLQMEHAIAGWSLPYAEWPTFVSNATEGLLKAKLPINHRLTVKALTTIQYWYIDNWAGHRHSFVRLDDAKRYAKRETGTSVTIHSAVTGDIVCFAPASGYCPP